MASQRETVDRALDEFGAKLDALKSEYGIDGLVVLRGRGMLPGNDVVGYRKTLSDDEGTHVARVVARVMKYGSADAFESETVAAASELVDAATAEGNDAAAIMVIYENGARALAQLGTFSDDVTADLVQAVTPIVLGKRD